MESNVQIIKGFKNGDSTIIINVFKHVFPIVKKYVLANSGTIEDAKELTWAGLEKFRKNCLKPNFSLFDKEKKPIDFTKYMYGICRYTWLDMLKKRNRSDLEISFPLVKDEQSNNIITFDFEDKTNAHAENSALRELETFVVECIGKLSEKCKEIFRLNALEEKAHKEIADEIGISIIASRKRLTDCRKDLKDKIKLSPLFKEFKDEKLIRKFIGY